MKIVFTAKGETMDAMMDPRFGRTDYLVMLNDENEEIVSVDNTDIANTAHGAGPQTAKKLFELEPDVLITGNGPGGNAGSVLEKANIKIYVGAQDISVKEAYDAFKKGELTAL